MRDPKLTPEKIRRAGELAEKGRIIPSGDFIQAMRLSNKAQNAKPLLETLSNIERAKLQKVIKEKKKK